MVKSSISMQPGAKSYLLRLPTFIAVAVLIFCGTVCQPCSAQQIPRRLDVSPYQNRGPTPPRPSIPETIQIEREISPITGKPVKVYQKPIEMQTLRRQRLDTDLPTILGPQLSRQPVPMQTRRRQKLDTDRPTIITPSPSLKPQFLGDREIMNLERRLTELEKERSKLARELDELKKQRAKRPW